MIDIQYQNNGAERLAEIQGMTWERVQRMTVELWTECMKETGVSNPRPYLTPSNPGEPPRLRTGHGQRNISYELDQAKGIGRVGVRVNARYMAFLDQGTSRVQPRPWLLATAKKIWARLQAIALGGQP